MWERVAGKTKRHAVRTRGISALFTVGVLLPLLAADLSGQELRELSLEDAIAAALAGNPQLEVSRAMERSARADLRAETSPLLPRLDARAGYIRSTDPVVAFGTKLRQGRFGEPDFGLEELNDPAPIQDFSTETRLTWSAVDPTAWASRRATAHRAEAATWQRERSREATIFATKALYFKAVGAEARLRAAHAAVEAAQATFELFGKRRAQGLLTEADLLQAEAELRAAEARLARVVDERDRSREELGLHLGWDPNLVPVPTDTLRQVEPPAQAHFRAADRADLRSLNSLVRAADADHRRASLAFVPALDGFAAYTTHARSFLDSDATDWTVGLSLRWNLFSGLGRLAERQKATLSQRIAEVRYQEAERAARTDVRQAQRGVAVVLQEVKATAAAARAAEDGRSLLRRRFEEGLATPADLLQAEARAANMRSRAVDALANYQVSLARLEYLASHTKEEPDARP